MSSVIGVEAATKDQDVRAIEHLPGGVFKVMARGVKDGDIERRFHKLQKRVALDDHVRGGTAAQATFRPDGKGLAQERHPFRQIALLGPQPKRALCARKQKPRAVGRPRGQWRSPVLPVQCHDMVGRSAVAIFPILRADAVAVLRDFSRKPMRPWQRGDEVAHQLRLANAARMPADYNQPARRGFFHKLSTPFQPCLLSSFLMRAASSGRRANQKYASLNLSSGRAGVPQTTCPLRMVLPVGMPACAPAIDRSSRVQWSAIPTCPPTTTCWPSVLDPEIP